MTYTVSSGTLNSTILLLRRLRVAINLENIEKSGNLLIFFLVPKASQIPRARKKWLENVNAGMTISPGGLPPENCSGAR